MIEEIIAKLKEYDKIIIHRHVRPDPDAYGSQGGLAEIIRHSFPEKKVYAAGKDEPTLLYLNRMDRLSDGDFEGALIIVCDTANEERIDDERYKLGDFLIKIDHHPDLEPYGDLSWVDPGASSTSEMIYELFLRGKDRGLKLSPEGARLLYAGIVGDTGRFLYPNATEKTFAYASQLIRYPFSRTELYDRMYRMKPELAKLNGYVLQNFEMNACGISKVILTKEMLEKFRLRPEEASLLVSTLGNIEGLNAWVFFIEEEDQIRVRFRSKGPHVHEVARKFGGGGHPMAAGASIRSWEEVDRVMKELEEAVCRMG
ncbi:MAG: bifunctional oligoribonuclease/PAP phosphatase NrnA [Caldibacillus debilis]|jgi:phosphoesterase RecJ-like protein|uniref:Exopolyphosphatase-related protein n=2 Tax=Caldibacillus debilis TaxID=301148 RepID=A0A420VFV1_9BACI|nr:bifunctional oligoribonuclease/PAP phosphatase NrnA [Caldibacillus debilis]MBO2481129.1 bifunctional oligoribonuclease/PAP phosphatase NrnA [Bacillaceae bacterium]MBY6271290.1 bifunctional oligoribonuclease/PAP phosphatase NrnA [Bacillaceae bacterium]OUM91080.1 MAG: oligoribonuclease [Caldibacillus debilis]REJ17470.1 MAG: bifunctional oligoribonuclease/PAP phosphatase NrnA [Caldibacillus debilis]REJ26401.1 MAG: bifunctional oligoribonuclease/PAP phosphatase NrnA [Caldibacillus debilis]